MKVKNNKRRDQFLSLEMLLFVLKHAKLGKKKKRKFLQNFWNVLAIIHFGILFVAL